MPPPKAMLAAMRILIVEDTADLSDAVQRHLRGQGHAVDCAATRDEAEAAWDVTEYDAVLLDLGLPDGSGLQLLRARRARGDRTPVLLLTTFDDSDLLLRATDAGAPAFLGIDAGDAVPEESVAPLSLDAAAFDFSGDEPAAKTVADPAAADGSNEASNGMYLLMLSHKNLKQCESTITVGRQFQQRFPQHIRAAEALYSVGQCQYDMQQKDIARETWKRVRVLYPHSAAAKRAAQQLK